MITATHVVAEVLYLLVGLVSLSMAYKCLSSDRALPFHQQATTSEWNDLNPGMKAVLLALTRLNGLGFALAGLMLCGLPVLAVTGVSSLVSLWIGLLALMYCGGLAAVNHRLESSAGSPTPWKGSVYAAVLVAVALALTAIPW